jgi:hypothetical protein
MLDPSAAARRCEQIREGENFGITSYLPRPAPELLQVRALESAMRLPIFQHRFRMGEVVNCRIASDDAGASLELSDKLVLPFEDRIENTGFTMKGEEEIFWGPNNARTVMLSLEMVSKLKDAPGTLDDLGDSRGERKMVIVIGLYEEDGSFLRTLGVIPYLDYASREVLVSARMGIALLDHPGKRSVSKVPVIPATLSALKDLRPERHYRL